jgi:hypothetical protein
MQVIEARNLVNTLLSSYKGEKIKNPEHIIDAVNKFSKITLGKDTDEVSGSPRVGYIKSNLKSVYYIIYCDRCNARCRKLYPTKLNINSERVLKFLCNKCAGVKYKRKDEYEKRALDYLLHPEKLYNFNVNNLRTRDSLAILEAQFMEEKIRERAEHLTEKYFG